MATTEKPKITLNQIFQKHVKPFVPNASIKDWIEHIKLKHLEYGLKGGQLQLEPYAFKYQIALNNSLGRKPEADNNIEGEETTETASPSKLKVGVIPQTFLQKNKKKIIWGTVGIVALSTAIIIFKK